eukprot:122628-Pleurochrysis_carterae.AAC.1
MKGLGRRRLLALLWTQRANVFGGRGRSMAVRQGHKETQDTKRQRKSEGRQKKPQKGSQPREAALARPAPDVRDANGMSSSSVRGITG